MPAQGMVQSTYCLKLLAGSHGLVVVHVENILQKTTNRSQALYWYCCTCPDGGDDDLGSLMNKRKKIRGSKENWSISILLSKEFIVFCYVQKYP